MADLTQTIRILFEGVDGVSDTVTRIGGNIEGMGKGMSSFASPFKDIAKDVMLAEAAVIGFATAGLAFAYKKSVELDAAMTDLTKVIGKEFPDQIKGAKDVAIGLSETYGVSSEEIIASIAGWKQAGYDTAESLALAKNSLDLVIAGDISAAESTELLVAALKGFNEPASEAGRYIDILNNVSNNFATNAKELGIAMSDISPIAQKMGFSMEETAGLVTPIIEVFRSGSEASTALKTGLLSLVQETEKVSGTLKSIGVSQRDANGELRSGKDIMMDVGEAFKNLDDKQKMQITTQLVGTDQAAKMVTVFDNIGKVVDVTTIALKNNCPAQDEVNIKLQSSRKILDKYKVSFSNLAAAVGDGFRGSADEAIIGMTEMQKAMSQSVSEGAFDDIFASLDTIFGKIGDSFKGIADALPEALAEVDFSEMGFAFEDLFGTGTDLFSAFFGDVDLSTVDGLASAIQTVIDAVENLTRTAEGIVETMEPMIELFGFLIDQFGDVEDSTANAAGEIVAVGAALFGIGVAGSAAGGYISELGAGIKGTKDTFLKWNEGLQAARGRLNALVDNGGRFNSVFSQMSGTMAGKAGLVGAAAAVGYAFGTLINQIPGVSEAVQGLIGVVDDFFGISDKTEFDESAFEAAKKQAKETREAMEAIPDEKKIGIEVTATGDDAEEVKNMLDGIEDTEIKIGADTDDLKAKMEEAGILVSKIPDEKKISIKVDGETESKKTFQEYLDYMDKIGINVAALPIEISTKLRAEFDERSFEKAEKAMNEKIPEEKKIDVKAKLDIAQLQADAKILTTTLETEASTMQATIEAKSATIQSMVEWEAKIDIAEAEASAKKVEAAFESVTATITSTGDVISSIFGAIGNLDTTSREWKRM